MNKKDLTTFISKYHLNGMINKILLESKDDNLFCEFVSDTKSVIGKLAMSSLTFNNDCSMGIYDTASFLKIISAIDEEFDVNVFTIEEEAKYIELKDSIKKAKYILSHPDIIPNPPKEIKLPSFDFEIEIDDEFITNFIKSKNALSESTTFAFIEEAGKLKAVINYDKSNQSVNTISFDVGDTIVNLDKELNFQSDPFKEILLANKVDFTTGNIKVSTKGLMEITFVGDNYQVTYYQVMLNN